MSLSIETLALAKKFAKNYTDTAISQLPNGIVYKGAVNYYTDLPSGATEGDAYTVLYKGSTGTVSDGTEYVWGKINNQLQWIPLGKVDQLVEVQYGVTSVDEILAMIEQGQIPYVKKDNVIYYYSYNTRYSAGSIDYCYIFFCATDFRYTSESTNCEIKTIVSGRSIETVSASVHEFWSIFSRKVEGFGVSSGYEDTISLMNQGVLPLSLPEEEILYPSADRTLVSGVDGIEMTSPNGSFTIWRSDNVAFGIYTGTPLIKINYNQTAFHELLQLASWNKIPVYIDTTNGRIFYATSTDMSTFVRFTCDDYYFTVTYNSQNNTTTYSSIINSSPYQEILYDDLVNLKISEKLIPGTLYRITDYVTKINGTYDLSALAGGNPTYLHYAKSAEHPFDLIVKALDSHTLDENASAVVNANDNSGYFDSANLAAWEIKYTTENSPSTYAWADSESGKGVIYYMKDEWNNEAPYDFKNIQFLAYALAQSGANTIASILSYDAINNDRRFGTPFDVGLAAINFMDSGEYTSPLSHVGKDFAVGANILGALSYDVVDAEYLSTFEADWYYTFSVNFNGRVDSSLFGWGTGNKISVCTEPFKMLDVAINSKFSLPCNIIEATLSRTTPPCNNVFSDDSNFNIISDCTDCFFDTGCYDNKMFGSDGLKLGKECCANVSQIAHFNTLGNQCQRITFDSRAFDFSNTDCCHNFVCDYAVLCTFKGRCSHNTLLSGTSEITLNWDCADNTLINCQGSSFAAGGSGDACGGCYFENCSSISISGLCGNLHLCSCSSVTVTDSTYSNMNNVLALSINGARNQQMFFNVLPGNYNNASITPTVTGYPVYIGLDNNGNIKTWNPADLAP